MDAEKYIEIAAEMLAREDDLYSPYWACLHIGLRDYLHRAATLCEKANGQLVSRQAIAVLILQWIDKYPDKEPYDHNRN